MEIDIDKLLVITGPSGVGKTSIAKRLLEMDLGLKKVVTTTTREPRAGEADGVDYHFIDAATFKSFIESGQIFEWASYGGLYYGSQTSDVEEVVSAGMVPMWVVDVQGAATFKTRFPRSLVIFIAPESLGILQERLEKRGDRPEDIKARIELAENEMRSAQQFDYQVINFENELDQAVEEAATIVEQKL